MSENKRLTNDKLQGSVATYLTHGTVVDNQTEKGLLLSLSVKKIEVGQIGTDIKMSVPIFCIIPSRVGENR